MSESEDSDAAGWYRDPDDPDYTRYWNGSAWVGRRFLAPGSARAKRQRALSGVANLIGLAFLVPVLLIAFLPTHVGTFDCGTWLDRSHPVATGQYAGTVAGTYAENLVDGECGDKLDDRRLWTLVLLGFGLVVRFGFVPVVQAVQESAAAR